jgi:hypothetical protein
VSVMGSSLSMDAPVPSEVLAALAYLEKTLEAAVAEGSLRKGLQWTAALEGRRPWLVVLNVQPVEALAEAAGA